jgi:hypothetical protein
VRTAIQLKNWSPRIVNNIDIVSTFSVSALEVAQAVTHYQLVSGGKTVE